MSTPTEQRAWILSNPPAGEIEADTFSLETRPLPELQDGEVLVAIEYFSNEPAQRTWMDATTDPRRLYAPPIKKGEIVRSIALAKILKSKSASWKEGQRVTGMFGWYDYGVAHESAITGEAV
ncbi:quinone oxidoreductase [Cryptotrichosporon argae]